MKKRLSTVLLAGLAMLGQVEAFIDFKMAREASAEEYPATMAEIREQFHDEKGNAVPVVFLGAGKSWNAMEWTPENLAEFAGELPMWSKGHPAFHEEYPVEHTLGSTFETAESFAFYDTSHFYNGVLCLNNKFGAEGIGAFEQICEEATQFAANDEGNQAPGQIDMHGPSHSTEVNKTVERQELAIEGDRHYVLIKPENVCLTEIDLSSSELPHYVDCHESNSEEGEYFMANVAPGDILYIPVGWGYRRLIKGESNKAAVTLMHFGESYLN